MSPSGPVAQADARLLAALERAFSDVAGADGRIDVAELKKALGLRTEYLARRIHALFDANGDGFVSREEFLAGARTLVSGSVQQKILFAYRLHDHDGDGALSREELARMVLLGLAEDDVTFDERAADRLVDTLMAEADRDRNGRITFDELEVLMARHPAILDQMTRSEARWLLPNEDLIDRMGAPREKAPFSRVLADRAPAVLFVAIWALVNVALFALGLVPHGRKPTTLPNQISHAATSCILWNSAVLLVPVLRRFVTWVRGRHALRALPVDGAVDFHRWVGFALCAFALVHTVAMVDTYAYASVTTAEFLACFDDERGLTGVALAAVLFVMWLFARGAVRKGKRFELFYFTHLLYVPFIVLAFLHASAFAGWMGAAVLGLAIELAVRAARRGKRAAIVGGQALRSGVTRVEIEKPAGFTFHPGDYVFLRVPAVARHEWHPFTLSSAPERPTLTVHVRSLGNWTSALRRLFEGPAPAQPLAAHVDGPYGSPSGHLFDSRHAVLVAAGIGVTPFASILESLVMRAGQGPSRLEKAYFFWLNRDQFSFEWFTALLAELERTGPPGLLDVRLFMTGGRSTTSSVALELARELSRAAGAADIVTGLQAKTHMGHPDWDRELAAIAAAHAPARVDVFFCGPPGLARKVHATCARLGMSFREERF